MNDIVTEIYRENVKAYLEPTMPRKGGLFLLQLSKKVQNDTEFRKMYIEEWKDSIDHTNNIQSLEYAVALGWDPWQTGPVGTSPEYKPVRVSIAKKMKELCIKKIDSREKEILLRVHPKPYYASEKDTIQGTTKYQWKPLEELLKELENL